MPRELAGLYWDDQRQRYFPIPPSSTPVSLAAPTQSRDHGPHSVAIKQRRSPLSSYSALSDLRSALRSVHKDALIHQIQSSQILRTDRVMRSTIPLVHAGDLSAFQTICYNGRVCSFAGDTQGWFYSSTVDEDREQLGTIDTWQHHLCLSSEISSIGVSGTACVATSFGPGCRVSYIPLSSLGEGIHVTKIDSRIVHDIWTTDLHGSRLVLGANKQAVVIEDIALCASLQRLSTQSDVLALAQRENVLYTGLRNGGVLRFDSRVRSSDNYPLFNSMSERRGSVTGLKLLHEHQLLVSFIDGGLSTFDLRFPVRAPLMTFTGNFNSYTVRLPMVTDSHEKFLFAAGQDNRIRLWSLITGGAALHLEGTSSTDQTVFHHLFEHRIAALQVVEDREGMSLWVASGTELYKYSLGHRSGIGIQGRSYDE